jgi:hypothetical protein
LTSGSVVAFRPDHPQLRSGEQMRTYPRGALSMARRYADLLDDALSLRAKCNRVVWAEQDAVGCGEDVLALDHPVGEAMEIVRQRLIEQILELFDPTGLELQDECGRSLGIIEAATEADEEYADGPLWARVIVEPDGTQDWNDFVDGLLNHTRSVAVPGSRRSGDCALIEAVRLRTRGARP